MHVRITDKGHEYAIRGKEKKTIHSIMSVLTNEEKRDLWEIISKIRKKAMEELGKDVYNLYPPSDINELCDSHRSFQIQ
jgi:hypothetical protein